MGRNWYYGSGYNSNCDGWEEVVKVVQNGATCPWLDCCRYVHKLCQNLYPSSDGRGGRAGCLDYPALSTPNISVQKYRGDNGVRPYVGEVEEMMCVVSVTTGAY